MLFERAQQHARRLARKHPQIQRHGATVAQHQREPGHTLWRVAGPLNIHACGNDLVEPQVLAAGPKAAVLTSTHLSRAFAAAIRLIHKKDRYSLRVLDRRRVVV